MRERRPRQEYREPTDLAAELALSARSERPMVRRAYLAPLYTYCEAHCIVSALLARRAVARLTGRQLTRHEISRIKMGYACTPDWFVAALCREIWQPIEVVMGAEWARRHLTVSEQVS